MRLTNLLCSLPAGKALNESKDRILSARLKNIASEQLKPFGEIVDLRVNTLDQWAACRIRLDGESEILDLEVRRFQLNKSGSARSIEIDGVDIHTSRQWLTSLLHDKLGRKTIALPPQFGWLIDLLS
jgi:hypothetical protein